MSFNGLTNQILGTISIILTIIICIPVILMIRFRKSQQPIMYRSPNLLNVTLISLFFSNLSISSIFYLNTNNPVQYTSNSCFCYSFTSNVLHLMIILPYFFRSIRVLNVFDNEDIILHQNRLKEVYYLRILFYIFILLVLNFLLINSNQTYSDLFPLDVKICNRNSYLTDFALQYFWSFVHISENICVFYFIIKLKKINDIFKICSELISIGVVWIFFECIFIFLLFTNNLNQVTTILFFNLVKNSIVFAVSGIIPLIKSYQRFYLPICTTKECAYNFNLMLMTEKTFESFYKFLKENSPEGVKLVNFWIDTNLFKFKQSRSNDVNILTTDIYEKYIKEGSESYIDFPSNFKESLEKSYLKSDKGTYSSEFDDLSTYVYNSLKENYFENYTQSFEFKKLEVELEKEEELYSRLVQSKMISNQFI